MAEGNAVTLCGESLDGPTHICAFFDSREERYRALVPFIAEGLGNGERVVTTVDAAKRRDHVAELAMHGIDVEDAIARDDLRIPTTEDTYTSGGIFSVERMYDLVQTILREDITGRRRVRLVGMMDWVARQVPGTDRLAEYEARLNLLVDAYACDVVCVYDLATLPGETILDILAAHPYVIVGSEVHENSYRVHAAPLLKPLPPAAAAPSAPH